MALGSKSHSDNLKKRDLREIPQKNENCYLRQIPVKTQALPAHTSVLREYSLPKKQWLSEKRILAVCSPPAIPDYSSRW